MWRSSQVDVRESHLGGLAVFANAPTAENEPVAVKVGHVVGFEEVQRLTEEIGDFSLQIAEGLFLSPRRADEYDDMVVHINHSCDANVGFEGNVTYEAVRDIDTGEELCHDDAMARVEPDRLDCLCGTDVCRGVVTETDWQRSDVQARYAGYVMPHVQARIDQR